MSAVTSFKRCVGESPPDYGSRRAYCFVTPKFTGPCSLHYEIDGRPQIVGFGNYQQALTAATMAIFSKLPFQNVVITASEGPCDLQKYPSAKAWLLDNSDVSGA